MTQLDYFGQVLTWFKVVSAVKINLIVRLCPLGRWKTFDQSLRFRVVELGLFPLPIWITFKCFEQGLLGVESGLLEISRA